MDHDEQDPVVRKAHRRVKLKLGFLTHLTVFVLVNAGLWAIAQITGGGWNKFPLWGWGLGLAIHGIVTLVALEGDGIRERMLRDEVAALRRKQP